MKVPTPLFVCLRPTIVFHAGLDDYSGLHVHWSRIELATARNVSLLCGKPVVRPHLFVVCLCHTACQELFPGWMVEGRSP